MSEQNNKKRSLPFYLINGLTILRIVFSPIILFLIISGFRTEAFIFFLLAVISDLLDGHLARRFHQCSELGKNLDALADLSLICSTTAALFILGDFSRFIEMAIILTMLMVILIVGVNFFENKKLTMPSRKNSTTINSYFVYVTLIFFILNSPYKNEVACLTIFIIFLTALDCFFRKRKKV